MIEVKNLVKTFDGFKALSGANLHVEKGSVYGLVGPNGSGKSTIIKNICGVLKPDSGSITIGGEPVFDNPSVKQRVAYIPDDVFFYSNATLNEMAKFYEGTYNNFDSKYFDELAMYFPKIDRKKKLKNLSKGMQRQAVFWLSIASRPDVMILDEPVDGLDPVMRRQVWRLLLKEVADREITVLVSSHNLRELEDVCDHVGIMSWGNVILERSLEELQENTFKVQMVFENEMPDLKDETNILHSETAGRVMNLIIKGNENYVSLLAERVHPLLYDILPLSLEEIFIYELGGLDYEAKEILNS